MRRWILLCLALAIVLAAGLAAFARPQTPQTPVGMSRQTLLENRRVRVLRLKLAPGATEGVHAHPYDVVETMLTPGDVVSTIGENTTRVHRDVNYTVFIPKGTVHAIGNYGKDPYDVLVVTILR